jgi:hypothetical protein
VHRNRQPWRASGHWSKGQLLVVASGQDVGRDLCYDLISLAALKLNKRRMKCLIVVATADDCWLPLMIDDPSADALSSPWNALRKVRKR